VMRVLRSGWMRSALSWSAARVAVTRSVGKPRLGCQGADEEAERMKVIARRQSVIKCCGFCAYLGWTHISFLPRVCRDPAQAVRRSLQGVGWERVLQAGQANEGLPGAHQVTIMRSLAVGAIA
jgi:hypothetical protein